MIKHQFAISLEVGRLASVASMTKRESNSRHAEDSNRKDSRRAADAVLKTSSPFPDGQVVF
jgi:hypothetical protein